jgi:hypothetical protein
MTVRNPCMQTHAHHQLEFSLCMGSVVYNAGAKVITRTALPIIHLYQIVVAEGLGGVHEDA